MRGECVDQAFGGLAEAQAVIGGPQVEPVALGSARGMEAAEETLAEVDRKGAARAGRLVVQGARPAALGAGASQGIEVAEVPQDVRHRHVAAERGDVQELRLAAGAEP